MRDGSFFKSHLLSILLCCACHLWFAFFIFESIFGADLVYNIYANNQSIGKDNLQPQPIQLRHDSVRKLSENQFDDDTTVNILLCSDKKDRYAMYTLINSILMNENEIHRLFFHILVFERASFFEKEFNKYFEPYLSQINYEIKSIQDDNYVECIDYKNIGKKYFRGYRLNNAMNMARFCAPNIFVNVSVAVYLDVDMIVRDSISKLYDEYYYNDQYEYTVWSVINTNIMEQDAGKQFAKPDRTEFMNRYLNRKFRSISKYSEPIAIDFQNITEMFNGGILMFNLDIWRDYNFTGQSLELFRMVNRYEKTFHTKPWNMVTQPIVNLLFMINKLEIGELGERWNFVIKHHADCTLNYTLSEQENIVKDQSIVHWAGKKCKPWGKRFQTFLELWLKYIPTNVNIAQWEKHFKLKFNFTRTDQVN